MRNEGQPDRIGKILTSTYEGRAEEGLSNRWKAIDHFKVRNLASVRFVKCFYISLAIGFSFFLLSLILFLIPVKTDDKERATKLEESISRWMYERKNHKFELANFKLSFNQTNLTLDDVELEKRKDYTYHIDKYYPTYDELFHVYDSRISSLRPKRDESFVLTNISGENIPSKFTENECIRFYFKNSEEEKEEEYQVLENMPTCNNKLGQKGLNLKLIKKEILPYTAKCKGINLKDCENLCKGIEGVLLGKKDNYECLTLKVARILCIGVSRKEKDDRLANFTYEGPCYAKQEMAYYTRLKPTETVHFNDLILMVRDSKDPYIKAYALSTDGTSFYNLNLDNSTSKTIKWLVFISGMIFMSLFFLHAILSLANENEIMKHNLQQRELTFFIDR